MRTGSSVRSEGSLVSDLATGFGVTSTSSPPSASSSSSRASSLVGLGFLVLDDVDAHLVHHRQHVFDLLGGDLLGRHDGVELLVGDVAALLRLLDHLLDGGIGEIEQRQRGIGVSAPSFSGVSASFGWAAFGGLPGTGLPGAVLVAALFVAMLAVSRYFQRLGTLHVPYPMV